MIVQLIPFFLAANMSTDEVGSWSNGPELEFDVVLRTKQHSYTEELPSATYNMTSKLRCRPRGIDTLHCMIADEKANVQTSLGDARTFENDKNTYLNLKFNENGVESITTDEDLDCLRIEFLKRIPGALSVGTNLAEQDRVFETQEDITMGRCATSMYLIKETHQGPNEEHPPNLHLSVPSLRMLEGSTVIEISKVRDVDTCNGTGKFFEYTERAYTKTEATFAVANMIITSPGTFKSYLDYRGNVLNEFRNDTIGSVEELFQIELVSVKEATDDPYVIEKPLTQSPMLSPTCGEDLVA